ncbi:Hypothetical protein R9X50_00242200 [Acrodontium crateriforme]|uniref:NADH:ubiquinone oxidoreductase intermediate-associated protein 30 domain-containing protein n=1 Tax=Acrodontium crateriforme TaxID=150365 RepID=A0AAQ3M144_9PEZI|nr:Hypothetical protein R9X50_00242200 [Acrodontium crateriforme]
MASASEEDSHASWTLFGGEKGWNADDWTSSDDRVRGGKSESFLECGEKTARFNGVLDIKTLGGAGFASQRTTGDERKWDLSKFNGIKLDVTKGDKKRYTLILKDTILPRDPKTGREQSTISWECDFELSPQDQPDDTSDKSVYIPFASLNPTYRGKLAKDASPLDASNIKRISIMNRSFFGAQEGAFSITFRSITAESKAPKHTSCLKLYSHEETTGFEKIGSIEANNLARHAETANANGQFVRKVLWAATVCALVGFAGVFQAVWLGWIPLQ